jgi:phenylalanyl-tRNA synthetase alpha chain
LLIQIQNGHEPSKEIADQLKKRKLIEKSILKYYKVEKGEKYKPVFETGATDLTAKMINTGSWKDLAFKPYNFNALGKEIPTGNLNPLLKVRTKFREVLLEMG